VSGAPAERCSRRRRTSLRLRLTLSYGALFFVVGLVMLGLTYFLMQQHALVDAGRVTGRVVESLGYPKGYAQEAMPAAPGKQQTVEAFLDGIWKEALTAAPRILAFPTFVALALATLVSIVAGWWVAGRMLRPINEIATVARSLSASTLHERIGLQGPPDELTELADTFDAMLVRLEKAFTAQREFVANASHELRTPLAIMRTELDVTLADPDVDAEELRRMAATIRAAIARSEDVIDSLLVLAESDDLAERTPLDLSRLVQSAAARFYGRARERALTVSLDVRPVWVLGEAALLERLADNLIGNAVQYSPQGAGITVEAGRDGASALLRVANGGDVIDESEVGRLFERFYRRDRSRSRRGGGSGLGLAIVAAIAEAHGGTATAEAPRTGGLTVTVRLPAAPDSRGDG
jgi:signal transduction histidine kinase